MKHIAAHTETGASNPGYISIAEESGHVTVSVRSRGAQTAGTIAMNRDQLQNLHREIGAYLETFATVAEESKAE